MRHVRVIHRCDDDVRQSDCADNCSSVIIMTWFPCILHSGSLCVVVTRLGHDHLYSYPPHIDPSLLPQSHTPSHYTFYTPHLTPSSPYTQILVSTRQWLRPMRLYWASPSTRRRCTLRTRLGRGSLETSTRESSIQMYVRWRL